MEAHHQADEADHRQHGDTETLHQVVHLSVGRFAVVAGDAVMHAIGQVCFGQFSQSLFNCVSNPDGVRSFTLGDGDMHRVVAISRRFADAGGRAEAHARITGGLGGGVFVGLGGLGELLEGLGLLGDLGDVGLGDLDLFLIGPDGTSVELSSDNGGSGNNFTDTLFDDDAETSVTDGSAPFTGSFRPEQPLADLNGRPGSGDWIFKVIDDAGIDTGSIESWQLQLTVNEPCDAVGIGYDS